MTDFRDEWSPTCPICGGGHYPLTDGQILICPDEGAPVADNPAQYFRHIEADGIIIIGPES